MPVVQAEAEGPPAPDPIEIDVDRVGAEGLLKSIAPFQRPWPKKRFAFLVTGFGVQPKSGGPVERKAAALEAAIVDAIGRAAREMQRDPKTGRAPVEYKMRLGPSLTVFGRRVAGVRQTVVMLDRRGRIYELCARNGVLAHPPHDGKIIQQIFAATNGRLVLQATGAADGPGNYRADVGCYRTADAHSATQPAVGQQKPPVIATGR